MTHLLVQHFVVGGELKEVVKVAGILDLLLPLTKMTDFPLVGKEVLRVLNSYLVGFSHQT